MRIPTEPIGSIPRPVKLIEAIAQAGDYADPALDPLYDDAIRDARCSPSVMTGEPVASNCFVGVVSPIDPRVETAEEVRDRVLEAAKYIPIDQLGTTDDCGFSPFSDDTSTARETAFAKIRARVEGTQLAEKVLGIQ